MAVVVSNGKVGMKLVLLFSSSISSDGGALLVKLWTLCEETRFDFSALIHCCRRDSSSFLSKSDRLGSGRFELCDAKLAKRRWLALRWFRRLRRVVP